MDLTHDQIEVHGEEGDSHPMIIALESNYPAKPHVVEDELGLCGGAFANRDDYWKYKDSSLCTGQ